MLDPELLNLLCCPETHQKLRVADAALLRRLNRSIAEGALRNRAGRIVSESINEGLLREDGQVVYPIRNDIPVMLVDEAIPLEAPTTGEP